MGLFDRVAACFTDHRDHGTLAAAQRITGIRRTSAARPRSECTSWEGKPSTRRRGAGRASSTATTATTACTRRTAALRLAEARHRECDRTIERLRQEWPWLKILGPIGVCPRGDPGRCEDNRVDYVIGVAKNSRLREDRLGTAQAEAVPRSCGTPVRRVCRAPTPGRHDRPDGGSTARGAIWRTKHLVSDRTSASRFAANQIRLLFSAFASILFDALDNTRLARATARTLQAGTRSPWTQLHRVEGNLPTPTPPRGSADRCAPASPVLPCTSTQVAQISPSGPYVGGVDTMLEHPAEVVDRFRQAGRLVNFGEETAGQLSRLIEELPGPEDVDRVTVDRVCHGRRVHRAGADGLRAEPAAFVSLATHGADLRCVSRSWRETG